MKKLTILKNLMDLIWIVTCIPLIFMLVFFAIYIFVKPDILTIVFGNDAFKANSSIILMQMLGLFFTGLALITIYCLYLFRKTLRYFQKVKPFDNAVIINFFTIGKLLTISGVLGAALTFLSYMFLLHKLKIHLGLSPQLILICLGLFFMILSEVFKIAKYAKEENDLTI